MCFRNFCKFAAASKLNPLKTCILASLRLDPASPFSHESLLTFSIFSINKKGHREESDAHSPLKSSPHPGFVFFLSDVFSQNSHVAFSSAILCLFGWSNLQEILPDVRGAADAARCRWPVSAARPANHLPFRSGFYLRADQQHAGL